MTAPVLGAALALLALSPQNAPVAPPPASRPVLQITAQSFRENEAGGSSAGTSGDEAGYIFGSATLCSMGASASEPTTPPGAGWRVSGHVVRQVGPDFVVQIDWQRTWERNARLVDGPKGSQELTMRLGDRLSLDTIFVPVVGFCGFTGAALEAAVTLRSVRATQATAAPRSQAVETLALAGGSGGAGGASGRSGLPGSMLTSRAGGAFSGGIVGSAPPAGTTAVAPFDAELWLVRTGPDSRTLEIKQIALRVHSSGARFAFPAMIVTTARGPVTVEVTGELRGYVAPGETAQLVVVIDRHVIRELAPRTMHSGTGKRIEMPAPGDIVSFEMPTLSVGPEQDLAGHQFSLRIHVTPSK